jgi:hypothetical protein
MIKVLTKNENTKGPAKANLLEKIACKIWHGSLLECYDAKYLQ